MVNFTKLKSPSWGGSFNSFIERLYTAKEIELAFGKSVTDGFEGGDGKVKWEWHFVDDIGHVYRVYDYKAAISENSKYDWHIGTDRNLCCASFRLWFRSKVEEAINATT